MTVRSDAEWHRSRRGRVHERVLRYVQHVEENQAETYDRFVKLAALYGRSDRESRSGVMTENVVASNVDTVHAAIATSDIRARFMTDGADWSQQRQARHMEWYAEGTGTLFGVRKKCATGFKACTVKGTGLNKVHIDEHDQIRVEPTMVDDIIVNEAEWRAGRIRQMHQRSDNIVAEDLIAEHPDKEEEILRVARMGSSTGSRTWAGYRPIDDEMLVVVESWKLPIGVKGKRGYKAGRHTKVIEGCDLIDEKWEEDFFPFAEIRWSEDLEGWHGIGGVERIVGHQRTLNKRNWQIDRALDQNASPTTFVKLPDAGIAVKTTSRIGTIVPYKTDVPKTVIPQAVSGETYAHRTEVKDSSYEEFGVSRLAATSKKPGGLDSGAALREYRDQTTQRFAPQEAAYEQFVLDTIWLVLWCCKRLGKAAPVIQRKTRFGGKKIPWAAVDMKDVRVQIAAASTLNRTPAGRVQAVIEYAQAGIVSQDEARRLLQHPDIERSLSLYTAALENVEHAIDEIGDGNIVMPEPFMNLRMCVWRGQQEYLRWSTEGAPEEILEALRQFVVQAAWMITMKEGGAANENAGAMPMDPAAMPPLPGETTAAPAAAFAPQAMQLRAG